MLGIVMLIVVSIFVMDLRWKTYEYKSRKNIDSLNNLKQIYSAQRSYSKEHQGIFANRFSDLYPAYLYSKRFLKILHVKTGEHVSIQCLDEWSDYAILSNLTKTAPEEHILLYQKMPNFENEINVCYISGVVKSISPDEFEDIIRKQESAECRKGQ